jgi:hypothetical protein
MRRSRIFGGLLLALSVAAPGAARADNTATAEALFSEGIDAIKAGDWQKACTALLGSEKAEPAAGTEINLGLCNEKQEKYASAWGWYKQAVGTALHHKPAPQTDRADNAQKDADRLWPKVHFAVINVKKPFPEGLRVTNDGDVVPVEALGNPLPIDAGTHTIEITASGKKPIRKEITIAKGPGSDAVDVPPFEDLPADKGAGAATPPPGGDYHPPVLTTEGSSQRTWGYVAGGAGIVALLVAGGLEGLALVVNGQAKDVNDRRNSDPTIDCRAGANASRVVSGTTCGELNDSYDKKKNAARSDQTAALVVGAAGVVLVGVGVVMILTSGPSKSAKQGRVVPVPILGPREAGLGLSATF